MMSATFFFTGEKMFTVITPKNSWNDRLYAYLSAKKDIVTKRLRDTINVESVTASVTE